MFGLTPHFLSLLLSGAQFRYKTRVYKQTNLDEKQLAKLHTKVWNPFVSDAGRVLSVLCKTAVLFLRMQASLKKFMDYIQTSAVDKMIKFIDKGLDPNFQDSDTGGKDHYGAKTPHHTKTVCSWDDLFYKAVKTFLKLNVKLQD